MSAREATMPRLTKNFAGGKDDTQDSYLADRRSLG